MGVEGDYLGMPLRIDALDGENLAYFRHCAAHAFHLQCAACGLLRYPPTTGCPRCGEAAWTTIGGRGAVPKGRAEWALRVAGNLVTPNGDFAPPELVAEIGIGTRVRMVCKEVALRLAVPLWTVDESAEQHATPWRYPEELAGPPS